MKYFLFLSIINIIKFLLIILPLLICVAFLTLIERKVLAAMQRRTGPNVLGFYGFLQPFADGLKLIVKETILPDKSNKVLFIVAPISMFFLSLIGWAVVPFGYGSVFYNINSGVLYLLAVSSLGIYGVIIAGWSSNSKYAFLGALRAAAQLISYEISIGFIVLTILLNTGSLNLSVIVLSQKYVWYCFSLWPSLIMFFISILAETNRPPFDLPEAEAELVSGYNVEYSALSFAFFFLAEYAHIVLMSTLTVLFFFGGWLPFPFLSWLPVSFVFSLKVSFFLFVFVWVRAVLPRYRYDQLMFLGWKRLLPLSFGYLLFVSGFIISFNLY